MAGSTGMQGLYHYRYMSEPITNILTEKHTTPTPLNRPHDIKVLDGGDYVIADKHNNRVVITSNNYAIKSTLSAPAKDQFDPYGIAINGGDILVTDNTTGRVLVYKDGVVRLEFGREYLKRPAGIAVFQKKIYVADWQENCVQVFNMNGKLIKTISKELDRPWFCTFNSKGQLLVADSHNTRIQVFEPQTSSSGVVKSIPVKVGDKPMIPRGIAVDANDTIFVTAMETITGIFPCLQCVVVYTQDGIPLGSFGDSAEFHWPRGITVTNGKSRKALITNDHSIKEVKL